jgi:membrane-associated phospholipid phosphatase
MVSDALVTTRDGIVGTCLGQTLTPAQRTLEDPANLAAWEPWVRAAVIDFELLSHLHFTNHSETFTYTKHNGQTVSKTSNQTSVTIWHLDVTSTPANLAPTATSSRVATFIRPSPAVFAQQLDFLDQYSDLRADRATEILCELGPQYAFWSSIVYLHPDRTKKTIELLDAALRLANFVEMRIKHALACRRPNELSSQVQPIILTPGHGTFPSGHSTENHMIARILWELRGGDPVTGEQLMRDAARIAVNRTVAGVHFPVDTAAGQVLGLTLGRYFLQRARGAAATGGAQFNAWRFDGERYPGTEDFDFHKFYNTANGSEWLDPSIDPPYVDEITSLPPTISPILKWLWDQAYAEWA